MDSFRWDFDSSSFNLYPFGDIHLGSPQSDEPFARQVVKKIKDDPKGVWVGMGDLMENALVGSKSDVYTQTIPPKEQVEYLTELLKPIKEKCLFLIAGNHEQRTMRLAGLSPEQFIAYNLGVPFRGFSCYAYFTVPVGDKCTTTKDGIRRCGFECYFHHNYGGGYTMGGKVNSAEKLRLITPTADAIFSGHFHITSRIPNSWRELSHTIDPPTIINRTGYDYITGSALSWDKSYAEERAKKPSSKEFIMVKFSAKRGNTGCDRIQEYHIITPDKEMG